MKYPYKCPDHGEQIALHPMGEQPDSIECPTCGKSCKRIFSGGDIQIPALWGRHKAGIREVTGGHSMQDIRYNGELRREHLA